MNTKKILGVVAVLALVAVAMVGAGAAFPTGGSTTQGDNAVSLSNGTTTEYYATAADAFKAVEDEITTSQSTAIANYTIKLLKSHESAGMGRDANTNSVSLDNYHWNITLDLNNYTLTLKTPAVGSEGYKTQGIRVRYGNTLAITNGTINVSASNLTAEANQIKMLMQVYSTTTLTNVTLDGSNIYTNNGQNAVYTLSTNSGDINITNSSIIASSSSGSKAFDVYNRADLVTWDVNTSVTVTNSTITGDVEMDYSTEVGTTGKAANNQTMTLTVGAGTNELVIVPTSAVTSTNADINLAADSQVTLNGKTWAEAKTLLNNVTKGAKVGVSDGTVTFTADVSGGAISETSYTKSDSKGTKVTLTVTPTYTFTVPAAVTLNSTIDGYVYGNDLKVTLTSNLKVAGKTAKVTIGDAGSGDNYTTFTLTGTGQNTATYNVGSFNEVPSSEPITFTKIFAGSGAGTGTVANTVLSVDLNPQSTDAPVTGTTIIGFKTVGYNAADTFTGTLNFNFSVEDTA